MSFEKPFEHADALFAAAVAEFAAQGYEQASLNTILRHAGMSKGQFYYHFDGKQALYLALIGRMIAIKRAFMAQTLSPAALRGDLFADLRTLLQHGLAFRRAHPLIDRFSSAFVKEKGTPIYARALAQYNLHDDALLAALVTAAAQRGQLRADLPPALVGRLIAHLLTHAAELIDFDDEATTAAQFDALITMLQSGLARADGAGQEQPT